MRRATLVLALATVLAAPAPASAKGIAGASVCGANGCHRVQRAAVRDGVDAYAPARAPARGEPFFIVRMRAHVSSGRVVEVFALDWLPRAGLTRPSGERSWTRPAPRLDRALRRAARGLRPHPAAELGSVADAPPRARVVEVVRPARSHRPNQSSAIALAAAAAGLLAIAARTRRRRRARHRRAPLSPRTP